MDIDSIRTVRALALDAAVRSLQPVGIGGGTSYGKALDLPSDDKIVERAKRFIRLIETGN